MRKSKHGQLVALSENIFLYVRNVQEGSRVGEDVQDLVRDVKMDEREDSLHRRFNFKLLPRFHVHKRLQEIMAKKAKSKGHGPSTKSPKKTQQYLSYNISDVPPELWAIIAHFASRQSLARLCCVSHDFYSTFSAFLYVNIVDPPLSADQSSRLITTLSELQKSCWKSHPALSIRQLRLTDRGQLHKNTTEAQNLDSLRNMYRLIPRAECKSGSALRVLHWNLEAGLDDLGHILGVPGHFPNLRELVVSSNGKNNNFNIRGLEVLRIDFSLHYFIDWTIGDKLCYKLSEALQMLPSSSPLLHTFQLKASIPFNEMTGDSFPLSGYLDLIATVNLIRLPALTAFDVSLDLSDPYDSDLDIDPFILDDSNLFPFLQSHPNLLDLTLNAPGTKLTKDIAFLPRLRSFKGSLKDSAIIVSHRRQLERLDIVLVHRNHWEELPSFETVPLPVHFFLTELHVHAIDAVGSVVKLLNELSPESFAHLVSSFPNITHLDVYLNSRSGITEYRKDLLLLTELQSLRVQHYRLNRDRPSSWAATNIFPPSDYTTDLGVLLSRLPQLACIDISVLGDHLPDECSAVHCCGCGGPMMSGELLVSPPEIRVDYHFSIIHTSSGRRIVNASFS
ncbi:hypothetical protein C8R44DRAFT_914994 [Mycena epipterygia]|nr:hypothetical protein C8R44DRAFT_914994 [Mycena epipterygia]